MRISFLCFFCLIFLSPNVQATHVMGGELTYECVTPGEYLWRLKLYRDCSGIPGNSVQPITIIGCGATYNLSLNLVSGPTEILSVCPSQIPNTSCNGGSLPGAEQLIYEGTIILPGTCTDYIASFRLCCRSNSVTTINNPGNRYVYIEAKLNTAVGCNNSPAINNTPIVNVCVGQPLTINPGTFDVDGDSLFFSLVDCLHDAGVPIDVPPYYSGTNPFSTFSGTVIDAQTGSVSFTPDIVQIGPICIRIEEYRNGVKIGEVVRDIQVNVLPCTNRQPTSGPFIENGQNTGSYSYNVCPDSSFCLTIEGNDLDGDNITMLWNSTFAFGNYTIANNNTTNPIGTFCWTPTIADLGPNIFTTLLVDNACPVPGITNQAYVINVVCADGLKVAVTAQLEGPYDATTGLMKDELRASGLLPLLEPYTALGYTHIGGGGGETTVPAVFSTTGPDAIVDWVFVELRSHSNGLIPVATRSALIQADGDIVDVDGSSFVEFRNIMPDQYWIVVRHRTHLDVMSMSPISLDGISVGIYNFRASGAFGGGLKALANGELVLYEGDINNDGIINAADRSAIWNARNQNSYLEEDSSLNGICSAADRSQNWNNRNQVSQVP